MIWVSVCLRFVFFFFFSSRRRHTRFDCDWSSDVCSSDLLMVAVESLDYPHQRTALLLLRWSGARRGEIARLTLDCLDAYPDGHPRLRIQIGRASCRERV